MADRKLIQSKNVPGTIDNIRALLQRLTKTVRRDWGAPTQVWESPCGERLSIDEIRQTKVVGFNGPGGSVEGPVFEDITPPTRGTWKITAYSEGLKATARIEAYAEKPGEVLLEFLDAVDARAIGKAFEEFCQMLTEQLNYHRIALSPVTDPIDKAMLEIVTRDPDLNDEQVGAQLSGRYNLHNDQGESFSRQAVNKRRKKLEAMGYRVR